MSNPAFAKLQKEAYLAVLRAFQSTKCNNWSHQQLLGKLREKLAISQDKHIECLERVLKEPKPDGLVPAKETTGSIGVDDAHAPKPVVSNKADVKKEFQVEAKRKECPKSQTEADNKKQKVQDKADDRTHHIEHSYKRLAEEKNVRKADKPSGVKYIKPTRELLYGVDEGGLNLLYGMTLETFWEEGEGTGGKWYSAIVSDFNQETRKHKLTYDYGTLEESFEWVCLEEEVRKENIRIADSEPAKHFNVGRTARCGDLPFGDAIFEKMLREGTREELQWMLAQTQRKIHALCADRQPPKNPTTKDEIIAGKIIERSKLIMAQRKKARSHLT